MTKFVDPTPTCALPYDDLLGEGPCWDDRSGRLSWVDIVGQRITTWAPGGESIAVDTLPDQVSLSHPCEQGGSIVAQVDTLAHWDGNRLEVLCRIEADNPHTRLNDACCDDRGDLWVGTYSPRGEPEAALHHVSPDGTTHPAIEGMHASNGLGWSPDGQRLFVTDTGRARIDVYRRVADGTSLEHERALAVLAGHDGRPDGLAVDREGGVWTAIWGGSRLHHYDPAGALDVVVVVPVTYPTSLAFGGPELSTLYVTTSRHHLPDGASEPLAGSLLSLTPAVGGLPTRRFAR